jgi:AcrR family transcriptional regulator
MARLTRAETQERNRAKVLAAARAEFAEHGFRDAKIDGIAERAELTRGAVYSNFPGKRALYFAVLADAADRETAAQEPGLTVREALGVLARTWVGGLPMATDSAHGDARLGVDLVPEIMVDEVVRRPFTQLLMLDAIVLGLALERLDPSAGRLVRVAEAALTTLHGASSLAAAAPGFGEIFNVVRVCEQLADLDLDDRWFTPPIVTTARAVDEPWEPPSSAADLLLGEPVPADGVVAVLGVHRLSGIEGALRSGADVTAVVVSGQPGELAPLVRLTVTELRHHLREAVPRSAWPRLRVVDDEHGFLAAAAGVPAVDNDTETAVRVEAGRITARADGYGACHAVTTPTRAAHSS